MNLNGAKGQLKTYVDTPSGTEEDVFVQVKKIYEKCPEGCEKRINMRRLTRDLNKS